MKNIKYNFYILFIPLIFFNSPVLEAQTVTIDGQTFKIDTLYPQSGTNGLNFPWEITYGPDDSLWVTEAHGYQVRKVHPGNGGNRMALDLGSVKDFNYNTVAQAPQGGLMGLALHPQLLSGKPYVYLALVYHRNTSSDSPDNSSCGGSQPDGNNAPCYYKTKILRYTYDAASGSLGSPQTILDNISGSNDHNSGRLKIGPLEPDGNYHLYYTVGDMGAGQFNNYYRTNNAQNTDVYEGKVLRLNTEEDTDADDSAFNRWIPNDNPLLNTITSKTTAVFSYGHRNAQGLVWGNVNGTWHLYSSEHGDVSDDEVNIIESGRNYGWPKVAGYGEDNYTTGDGATYTHNDRLAGQLVTDESSFCTANNVRLPIFTFFSPDKVTIQAFDWPTSSHWPDIFTWWTVAPSSIDFYGSSTIPGWSNSLLVTSLKYGMFRIKLDASGQAITGDTVRYMAGNRVRDMAISPTGDTLFFAIDKSGSTSGPTGGFSGGSNSTQNAGFLLRMVYLMGALPLKDQEPVQQPDRNTLVKVYPNPASRFLFIESKTGARKPLRVEMYDLNGIRVLQTTASTDILAISLHTIKPGIYVLKLYNGYGATLTTKKVIVR